MAAAGELFHNLGSFASVGSSTHASQTGSSEFLAISNTGHFGPSGGKVSSLTWCYGDTNFIAFNSIQNNVFSIDKYTCSPRSKSLSLNIE
jgi:hypothetical protein